MVGWRVGTVVISGCNRPEAGLAAAKGRSTVFIPEIGGEGTRGFFKKTRVYISDTITVDVLCRDVRLPASRVFEIKIRSGEIMPVTFLWITANDYLDTGNRYGSNVQLFRDKEGVHLKVVWCANGQYIGRVLKKKHNRTVCSGAFDSVVSLLEKAECRLKLVSVT